MMINTMALQPPIEHIVRFRLQFRIISKEIEIP